MAFSSFLLRLFAPLFQHVTQNHHILRSSATAGFLYSVVDIQPQGTMKTSSKGHSEAIHGENEMVSFSIKVRSTHASLPVPGLEHVPRALLPNTLADISDTLLLMHRSVYDNVHFSSIAHGEDSLFVRNVLYAYGREKDAIVFVNRPLTITYYERCRRGEELQESGFW